MNKVGIKFLDKDQGMIDEKYFYFSMTYGMRTMLKNQSILPEEAVFFPKNSKTRKVIKLDDLQMFLRYKRGILGKTDNTQIKLQDFFDSFEKDVKKFERNFSYGVNDIS